MLIHDFVHVARPYPEVRAVLLDHASTMFEEPARHAYSEGEQLTTRLEPSPKHPRLGRRVFVDVGRPYERPDCIVLPLHWWAPGAAGFFPRLDADLELAPIGPDATQITLMGQYDPPLGALGRGIDRMLMHRVAEASIRSFLAKVADALTSPAGSVIA